MFSTNPSKTFKGRIKGVQFITNTYDTIQSSQSILSRLQRNGFEITNTKLKELIYLINKNLMLEDNEIFVIRSSSQRGLAEEQYSHLTKKSLGK